MVTIERRTPQEVGFDAFRVEYKPNISENVLIDDIVSYLGEYRFNLPKYSYLLKFSDGKIRNPYTNDSMEEVSQRAIDLKVKKARSSIREKAEKKGFQSLDRQLVYSESGDTIIWVSPPGPKEEGYGDYGFVYFGKVKEGSLEEKNIKMTAIRVESPSIEQFRKAIYMITGENENFEFAEEFLESPKVINQDLKEDYVDAILKRVFDFEPNEKEQEKFRQIIKKMFPLIYDFSKNPRRSRYDLYALENYALELKRDYDFFDRKTPSNLQDLAVVYRDEPPKVMGSCGSTSANDNFKTSNIFNSLSSLSNLFSEDEWFTCPKCRYKADGPVGDKCPGCGLTKEDYAKETGGETCG